MNNVMMRLSAEDFTRDPHAVKYGDQLREHRNAFERLFSLLNDPANEQRLIDAESYDKPALAGVVRFIEADPKIATVVESNRFRQTVGVAVKLKMEKLGWEKTGKKGTVTGARHFVSAERYTKRRATESAYTTTAMNALKAVSQIGDDREREETGREIMEALATTRRESGRVF